jgi:hypothetical protein
MINPFPHQGISDHEVNSIGQKDEKGTTTFQLVNLNVVIGN